MCGVASSTSRDTCRQMAAWTTAIPAIAAVHARPAAASFRLDGGRKPARRSSPLRGKRPCPAGIPRTGRRPRRGSCWWRRDRSARPRPAARSPRSSTSARARRRAAGSYRAGTPGHLAPAGVERQPCSTTARRARPSSSRVTRVLRNGRASRHVPAVQRSLRQVGAQAAGVGDRDVALRPFAHHVGDERSRATTRVGTCRVKRAVGAADIGPDLAARPWR